MNHVGTLNPNFVWLFALGATLLGLAGAFVTQDMSAGVSSAVYFGVFTVAAFGATFLTTSGTGRAILAFLVGSLLSAGTYYFLVATMTAAATEGFAGEQSSAFGAVMGAFIAAVVLIATFIASVTGAVTGSRFRAKLVS